MTNMSRLILDYVTFYRHVTALDATDITEKHLTSSYNDTTSFYSDFVKHGPVECFPSQLKEAAIKPA